jgi:hypothetical protein
LVLVDDIAYDFPELHELLYAVADHFEDLASVGVLVFGCEMVGLVEIGLGDDVASVESGFSESRERGLQEFEDNRDVFRSDSGKIRQHVKVGSIENGGLEGMSRIGGKVEIETGTFGTSHGSRRYVLGDRYGSGKNVKEPSSATLFDIGVVGDVTASAVVTAVVAVLIASCKALHSKACINFFPHYLSLPSLGCRIEVVGSGGRVVWAVTGTLSSTSTPKLPLILTVAVRRGRRRLLAHGLTKDLPTGTALAASRSHDKIEY